MPQYTKISFNHRKDLADYGDLVEMLFPGNRNQQHASACIFFELKWAQGLVPNLSYLEKRYDISRRILQRSRAKLARLGLIEHISSFNKRYNVGACQRAVEKVEMVKGCEFEMMNWLDIS